MSRQQGVLGRYILELKEVPKSITADDLVGCLQLFEDPRSTIVRISRLTSSKLQCRRGDVVKVVWRCGSEPVRLQGLETLSVNGHTLTLVRYGRDVCCHCFSSQHLTNGCKSRGNGGGNGGDGRLRWPSPSGGRGRHLTFRTDAEPVLGGHYPRAALATARRILNGTANANNLVSTLGLGHRDQRNLAENGEQRYPTSALPRPAARNEARNTSPSRCIVTSVARRHPPPSLPPSAPPTWQGSSRCLR